MNLIDYRNGIYAFDAGYVRHQLAAIHLIVDNGRAAFIDNGSNSSLPHALRALEQLGLNPAAVDYVIVTHIHLDHAGGSGAMMQAFPQARFVVHPRGARHMIDPTKLMAATEEVYGRATARSLYGELIPVPAERVIETHDGMVLKLGQRELAFYDSPGHAKHHVFIHDRAANGIFTGDTFGISYRECDVDGRPLLMPSTTPSQFDPVDLRDSVERMIALEPEAVYLTHFSRLAPPRLLAGQMLRRLDDFVGIALKAKQAGGDVLATIKAAMASYFLAEARTHGVTLPDEEILALWRMDIDLDSQGLAVWATQ
ncbi:MAG: MBL fold metallo-hydrolase [Rhodocyclaceae bacterium]|nr:MBL fold metallo-hydrolase [Rhodocyclaceae bacterium]MDZ4216594.1 MBL fold metallo-hydrolase [Rhodocyclaceae bacterium]